MLPHKNPTPVLFRRYIYVIGSLILILSILGLSAAILSMLFGKPIGDDYGAINAYRPSLWLNTAIESIATTGRYGQSILATLSYSIFGEAIVWLLPILVLGWSLIISTLFTKVFLNRYLKDTTGGTVWMLSFAVSIVLVFLILSSNALAKSPDGMTWITYQLFFWPSGIVTYTMPFLICISGMYAIFISRLGCGLRQTHRLILFTILVYISSLFNETLPATLFCVLITLFILAFVKKLSHKPMFDKKYLLFGMAAVGVGLLTLFFSPGSMNRRKTITESTPTQDGTLVESVVNNFAHTLSTLYLRPKDLVLLTLVGVTLAMIIFWLRGKHLKRDVLRDSIYFWTLPIVCIGSIIVSLTLLAIGYGYTTLVYPRAMLIPQISYVLTVILLAFYTTVIILHIKQLKTLCIIGYTTLSLLYIFSTPYYVNKITTQVHSSVHYYTSWTVQDALLRNLDKYKKMQSTIQLERPALGLGDGFSLRCSGPYYRSTVWLNYQISDYYDIPLVCSDPVQQ